MRKLLDAFDRLAAQGPVGRAVVTRVWGSAPRGPGACLLVNGAGEMAGSVSGGCVEGATIEAVQEALATGARRVLTWSVSNERAWEVGLACGGTISILVEPAVHSAWLEAARSEAGSVLVTPLSTGSGALLVHEDGTARRLEEFPEPAIPAAREAALAALSRLESGTMTLPLGNDSVELLLEVLPRRPELLIIGAVHVAAELARLARLLGFRVVIADGREQFLTRDRFPDADELLLAWPTEAFTRVPVTSATAVCVLSHDPKFDEPALELALRSPAGYIGAIGSKTTQAARRDQLRAAGFDETAIARIHGPIGLDLGGREPAEIALAILAEITAHRHGRHPKR